MFLFLGKVQQNQDGTAKESWPLVDGNWQLAVCFRWWKMFLFSGRVPLNHYGTAARGARKRRNGHQEPKALRTAKIFGTTKAQRHKGARSFEPRRHSGTTIHDEEKWAAKAERRYETQRFFEPRRHSDTEVHGVLNHDGTAAQRYTTKRSGPLRLKDGMKRKGFLNHEGTATQRCTEC